MRKVISLMILVIFSGCASVQPVVGPTPDGRGARVGFMTRTGEIVENNWGKILTGAAVIGLGVIANNNDWFQGNGSSKTPSAASSGSGDVQVVAPVINGNYNNVEIFIGTQTSGE